MGLRAGCVIGRACVEKAKKMWLSVACVLLFGCAVCKVYGDGLDGTTLHFPFCLCCYLLSPRANIFQILERILRKGKQVTLLGTI